MTDTLARGIDIPFDEPWFLGSPGAPQSQVPNLFQIGINGHGYIIDPAGYSRVTVPLRRESTDESVEPGEQTLNTGGAWKRSQDNVFLGAGQEFLDNRFAFVSVYTHSGEDPSVRTRFWRSKGINPWNEGAVSLLPEYVLHDSPTTGNVLLENIGDHIFSAMIRGGNQLLNSINGSGAITPIMQPSGSATWPTIYSMDTDGSNLFLACGTSGVAQLAPGATTATWLRPTAPAPVVTASVPASTTYTYYIVAVDANGYKSLPSAATVIANGSSTLNVTDYNELVWTEVNGADHYDILVGDTAHTLGSTSGTSFTDDGSHATVAYTAPTGTTQNFQATFVEYGNTFLLAAKGPQLVSVGANGTTTLVMLHSNPSFQWACGCGAPGNIYVAGNAGNESEVYGVQISTTNYALGAPYIAGQLTDGENVNAMLYYEGMVIFATSLGVRGASTSSTNGFLTTGPVITDLGPSTCLAVYGQYVWFGVTDFAENDGVWQGGSTVTSGLGRLNLNQYSSALLPAYASDVMSTVEGVTTDVAILNGVPWFGIADSGTWWPSGNLVEQGFLESGYVRYGTIEDKILVSTSVQHDPLKGEIDLQVVPFGQPGFTAITSTEQGSTGPPYYVSAGNYVGEAFMIIPVLTRSTTDATLGPVLRRWTSRAMIIADRQDQIVVPIIWYETVQSANGTYLPMDLVAEWKFLKNLEANGTAFIYQEGSQTYTAFIDQVEMKVEKWNDARTMLMGICSVKLLTVN